MSGRWDEAAAGGLPAGLLLASLTGSVLTASLLLLAAGPRRLPLGLLAFLLGLDALLGQAASILLLGEPSLRPPSCRVVALFSLLFLVLIPAALASLAAFPSPLIPPYLHFLFPPFLALAVTLPSVFPEIAPVRYFHDRYTCGFVNLEKAYAVVILLVGFGFPFSVLAFFTCRKSGTCRIRRGSESHDGRTIVYLVSLCSILLIPHIIQINITHFSSNLLKTKRDNEIIYTGVYDTFSMWLRYEFNLFTPIVLFIAVKGTKELYKHVQELCSRSSHLVKSVRSGVKGKRVFAKATTPVLMASGDGLWLVSDGESREAEPPEPGSLTYQSSTSKGESSTSTSATDSSKTFKERRNPGNKKIVRFAHSVKEITWKDTDKWNSLTGSSRDRF